MTILILSNSLDVHADDVADALTKRGADFLRLNTDYWYSEDVRIHLGYPESGYVSVGNTQVALTDITSVLYRRPFTIEPEMVDDPN